MPKSLFSTQHHSGDSSIAKSRYHCCNRCWHSKGLWLKTREESNLERMNFRQRPGSRYWSESEGGFKIQISKMHSIFIPSRFLRGQKALSKQRWPWLQPTNERKVPLLQNRWWTWIRSEERYMKTANDRPFERRGNRLVGCSNAYQISR